MANTVALCLAGLLHSLPVTGQKRHDMMDLESPIFLERHFTTPPTSFFPYSIYSPALVTLDHLRED